MTQVVDYSAGRATAAQIKAAGFVGAVRYLRKKGDSNVVTLAASEVEDFTAAGLALGLIYEDPDPTWMLGGRATGIDRATWALEQASAVGIEDPRCIYLAADHHADAAGVAKIMECLDGARTVLGDATGIYGFVEVIAPAMADGHAEWFWQGGRRTDVVDGCHLYQHNNDKGEVAKITCDINDVLRPDWGQWPDEGDDMWSDDEKAKLLSAADQILKAKAQGQVDFAGTVKATLGTAQGLVNKANHQATQLSAVLASLDPAAFAAELVKHLPSRTAGDQAAVEAALRAVLASPDLELLPVN